MVLKKYKKGFTLIEILVAVAIFSIVVAVAIGIFTTAMKSQRKILAQQELLDQTSYVMEYMSRALRMAKKDLTGDCLAATLNYNLTYSAIIGIRGIKFKNYNNDCQEFYLDDNGQLREVKNGVDLALTSPDFNVKIFKISHSGWEQVDNIQPAVTIFLDIEGKEGSEIKIQTTISQRNLDVKY